MVIKTVKDNFTLFNKNQKGNRQVYTAQNPSGVGSL